MLTEEELELIGGSNTGYKVGVCDPRQITIENLEHEYVTKVPVNEQLYLSCKRPYGYRSKDKNDKPIIENSFYVMCEKSGSFKGLKNCEKSCDVSHILSSGRDYDLQKTKNLTTGGSVSGSKLILDNETIEIFCFDGYMVKDLSNDDTAVKSFKYTCGSLNPDETKIQQCIKQPAKFTSSPPKSKYKEGDKIMKNCRASSLVIPNAVIVDGGTAMQGGTIPEAVPPGKTINYECQPPTTTTGGLSNVAELGNKVAEKFTVTCDSEGRGNFIGVKGCSSRCNVTELKKRTGNNVGTVQVVNSTTNVIIGTIENKNESGNKNLFTDIHSKVKVNCKTGYQDRKTFKDHYFANCLPGGQFDVSPVPVCEEAVKPCNNSDIDIDGILTIDSIDAQELKNGVTQVGSSLKVACKGGIQYDVRPGNTSLPMVPRCVYDAASKQGKWTHDYFRCYDGCIFESKSGTRKLETGLVNADSKISLLPLRTYIYNRDARVGTGGTAKFPTVHQGLRTGANSGNPGNPSTDLFRFFEVTNTREPALKKETGLTTISGGSGTAMYFTDNKIGTSQGGITVNSIIGHITNAGIDVGMYFNKQSLVYYCKERQTKPEEYIFNYKLLRVASMTNIGSDQNYRTIMSIFTHDSGCETNGMSKCRNSMIASYKIPKLDDGEVETYEKMDDSNMRPNNTFETQCNEIKKGLINELIPNLYECEGGVMHTQNFTCQKDSRYNPAVIETISCTQKSTKKEIAKTRTAYRYQWKGNDAHVGDKKNKNPTAMPALERLDF